MSLYLNMDFIIKLKPIKNPITGINHYNPLEYGGAFSFGTESNLFISLI